MEYSQVSTDDREVKEKTVVSYNYYLHPCHFLEEAVRAFFKCLGIETKADQEEKHTETKTQKITPSSPQAQLQDDADPSVPATTDSSDADPPSSTITTGTTEVAASTMVISSPARRAISRGGGGQIN